MAVIPLPSSPLSCLQLSLFLVTSKYLRLFPLSAPGSLLCRSSKMHPPSRALQERIPLRKYPCNSSPPAKLSSQANLFSSQNVSKRTSLLCQPTSKSTSSLYQKPLLTEYAPTQRLLQIPSFTGVSSSLAHSIALVESIAASLEAARGS